MLCDVDILFIYYLDSRSVDNSKVHESGMRLSRYYRMMMHNVIYSLISISFLLTSYTC